MIDRLRLGTEVRLFRVVVWSGDMSEDRNGAGPCVGRLNAVAGSIRFLVWLALKFQIYGIFDLRAADCTEKSYGKVPYPTPILRCDL